MYSSKVTLLFLQRVVYDQGCQHSTAGKGDDGKVGEASSSVNKGGDDKKRKRQAKKHKKTSSL